MASMISDELFFMMLSSTRIEYLSTLVVRQNQRLLHNSPMNMGKRIQLCLAELGWERIELLNRVPDLSPAALSALIIRDSKWSDLAVEIACALGVHLEWLLRGTGPKWLAGQGPKEPQIDENRAGIPDNKTIVTVDQRTLRMIQLFEKLDEEGKTRAEQDVEIIEQLMTKKRNPSAPKKKTG